MERRNGAGLLAQSPHIGLNAGGGEGGSEPVAFQRAQRYAVQGARQSERLAYGHLDGIAGLTVQSASGLRPGKKRSGILFGDGGAQWLLDALLLQPALSYNRKGGSQAGLIVSNGHSRSPLNFTGCKSQVSGLKGRV